MTINKPQHVSGNITLIPYVDSPISNFEDEGLKSYTITFGGCMIIQPNFDEMGLAPDPKLHPESANGNDLQQKPCKTPEISEHVVIIADIFDKLKVMLGGTFAIRPGGDHTINSPGPNQADNINRKRDRGKMISSEVDTMKVEKNRVALELHKDTSSHKKLKASATAQEAPNDQLKF